MSCSEARAESFDCCLFADHNDRGEQRVKQRKDVQITSQQLLGLLVSTAAVIKP